MDLSKVYDNRQAQGHVHPRHMELREHQRRPVRDARRLGPHGYFYDKDVFDKAGISEPPATLDEFYEDAKKIRATGSYITNLAGTSNDYQPFTARSGRPVPSRGRSMARTSPST